MSPKGPDHERTRDRLLQQLIEYLEPILKAAAKVDAVQARCGIDPPYDSLTGPELNKLREITATAMERLKEADYRREAALLAVELDFMGDPVDDYNLDGLLAVLNVVPTPKKRVGREVAKETARQRKLVVDRWMKFSKKYKELGYTNASWEFFAQWSTGEYDDMPTDDPQKLEKMVRAHRRPKKSSHE